MPKQTWTVECPHCNITVEISEWNPGTAILCLHCRKKYLLMNPGEESPLEIRNKERAERRRTERRAARRENAAVLWKWLIQTAKPLGFALLIIATLIFGFSEPPYDLLHYMGIASIVLIVAGVFSRRRPRTGREKNRILFAAFAVIIVCFAVRGYFDTETYYYSTVRDDGGITDYEDTSTRFGHTPLYRKVTLRKENGSFESMSEGPRSSDTGKPHGMWKYFSLDPYDSATWWYWYGEQVTEGEWHLRNNGR